MTGFVIVDGVERNQVEWLQEERRRLMTDLAAERERCAKVCEEIANHREPSSAVWLRLAAEEIRKGE